MHLAQGKPGQSAVAYPHYHIERRCRILVIGSQLKATTRYRALLRHISIGGAMLDFNAAILLPKHFFLEVDGCTAAVPNSGVRFNMLLAQDFLSRLIRVQFSSGLWAGQGPTLRPDGVH
jgi:hypothetical protein